MPSQVQHSYNAAPHLSRRPRLTHGSSGYSAETNLPCERAWSQESVKHRLSSELRFVCAALTARLSKGHTCHSLPHQGCMKSGEGRSHPCTRRACGALAPPQSGPHSCCAHVRPSWCSRSCSCTCSPAASSKPLRSVKELLVTVCMVHTASPALCRQRSLGDRPFHMENQKYTAPICDETFLSRSLTM